MSESFLPVIYVNRFYVNFTDSACRSEVASASRHAASSASGEAAS
jgi:hypothetical protein